MRRWGAGGLKLLERRWRDGELELWEGRQGDGDLELLRLCQGDGGVGGEKTWCWFEEEVEERAGREV